MAKKKAEVLEYEDEAAALLVAIGPWVELKKSWPSSYRDILKATREFLTDFKSGNIKIKPKKEVKALIASEEEKES